MSAVKRRSLQTRANLGEINTANTKNKGVLEGKIKRNTKRGIGMMSNTVLQVVLLKGTVQH